MPAGKGRRRKLTRAQIAWLRRSARKRERFVEEFEFPRYLWKRVRRRLPGLSREEIGLVERGLREWFVCCAWQWNTLLGMPSRAVDEAWHEFILDTRTCTSFCQGAFGRYLNHTPDEAMGTPMDDALGETVRAWDRSEMGRKEDSILWDLDEQLGVEKPLRVDGLQLAAVRSHASSHLATGGAYAGYVGACFGGAGGAGWGGESGGGGGCGGGGCSGGGGCGGGGGGCGGGGGG